MRGEIAGLVAVAAFGIVVQVLATRQVISRVAAESVLGQSTWLGLGMALALASVVVERRRDQPRIVREIVERPELCWLGAVVALAGLTAIQHPGGLFALLVQVNSKQPYARTFASIALTYVFTALLVLPAVFGENAGGVPRRVLAWAPLAWLGLVSYGVYLYHLTVAQLIALPSGGPAFTRHLVSVSCRSSR